MITLSEAQKLAQTTLSEKRYRHTVNVSALAQQLAQKNGLSGQKAALAGMLHDICKELPRENMLQIFTQNDIMKFNIYQRPFPVWHGFCAAAYAQQSLGVQDEEILDAVRWHSTGRENMTLMDMVLYMADMTSAERSYPEVAYLREAQQKNLPAATAQALGMSLQWLQEKQRPVDELSQRAYEYMQAHYSNGGKK